MTDSCADAAWQEGERSASKDLQAGGYRDFETANEALDWIFDAKTSPEEME